MYIAKGFMKPDQPTESWQMKEDFAKLLRAMGRDDEAEQTERESRELKAKDPKEQKSN